MNLILLQQHELDNGQVILRDHRSDHIRTILKAEVGDRLRVGLVNGPLGQGVVCELDRKSVTLAVELGQDIPPVPQTDLILALPRPIMLKRVLAQATALGVARIFLVNANRVEKSFFNASLLQDQAYERYLLQGLEQAMDTRVPELSIHKRFRPFVEDLLPGLMERQSLKLVAHPTAKGGLENLARPPIQGAAALAIGPEGGWLDFEIEKLQEQGFTPFTLGDRILRVDTAVPVILGQLNLLRRFSP